MTHKAVLFSLSGGGDTDIFLASPQALAWCNSLSPGEHVMDPKVLTSLSPFLADDIPEDAAQEAVDITPGSADNDAALFLALLCRSFDTHTEALAFAAENDMNVIDEYHGCIY